MATETFNPGSGSFDPTGRTGISFAGRSADFANGNGGGAAFEGTIADEHLALFSTLTVTVSALGAASLMGITGVGGDLDGAAISYFDGADGAGGDIQYDDIGWITSTTPGTSTSGTGVGGQIVFTFTQAATPPAITSSNTANVEEGNTTVLTVTATGDPAPTFSITGGVDAALFSINSSSGALTFDVAPDYEVPTDDDEDNVYVVQVTATNTEDTDDQVISVTVTNDTGDDPSSARKKYIVALLGLFD